MAARYLQALRSWRSVGADVAHGRKSFQQHKDANKHKLAESALKASGEAAMLAAPEVSDFQELLVRFRQGKANGDSGVGPIARRRKVRTMKWCLAEALRTRTRLALRAAQSLSLHSDASKGRLLVRGQMCGEDLQPHHALLGTTNLSADFDSSALGLASAVVTCLSDLAAPSVGRS